VSETSSALATSPGTGYSSKFAVGNCQADMSANFAKNPATDLAAPMGHEPSRTKAVDFFRAACLAPSRKTVCTTILTVATLVIAPYLLRGYTVGHDIGLHASWWLDISALWRQGILYPRWSELAYYGYGEPTFVFYPPISLYLGGMLTSLLPFRVVPGVYVWLVLVLAGFSFFHLCRQFLDARYALLGAVVYVMNPYHLLQVHERYSFAELLISALLPLLVLAIYRLDEPGGHRIAIAALLFAVIALTNMPGTVVGSYSGFAFVMGMMLAQRPKRLAAKLLMAAVLGAGLAAFHLLPSWYEQRWVLASIHPMTPPEGQFVRLTSLPPNRFLWALAGVEAAQIVIGALAWAICRRTKPRDVLWAFAAVFLVSIIMVLPLSAGIWSVAPFLHYVQFPWRWLGPMALAMSLFLAAAAQQSSKGRQLAAAVCALCLVMIGAVALLANTRAAAVLSALKTSISEGRGYLGWAYVLPRDIKVNPWGIPEHLTSGEPLVSEVNPEVAGAISPKEDRSSAPLQNSSRISVTRWAPEIREVTIDTPQPAWIRFRLFRFPGWHAYVDGAPSDTLTTDARGAMVLRVPSGRSNVKLGYELPRDQVWGIVLSSLSLVCWLWMFRRQAPA
jgi:6-pyruvoyl-tetrahydropterin synthase-like protein